MRFDGCEVVAKIHAGPISELYKAIQRPLGRPVLIKSIGSSILPSSPFAASLEREALLLSELDHPNIVELHDFVRREDRMWIVLEHVDGWSLEEMLTRCGKLGEAAALGIAVQVARALAHAHEKGVCHRDIKPRNLLVSRRGEVKVINFSVASAERLPTAPELLDAGASYLGPSYMSPEQILGEPPDPRSDLFSLGVVLYESLAGERPFTAADERNESLRIRSEPPAPLSRHVAHLSSGLERAVQRCLEKMPSDRFQSAADLLEALEALLHDTGAREPSDAVAEALVSAGLLQARTRAQGLQRPSSLQPRTPSMTLGRASAGLVIAFVLLAAGAAMVQLVSRRGEARSGTQGGSAPLELVPSSVAYLRVVAHPWAHVIVDGQHVDTTPFARPIPITAGTHFVRFEHPNAPAERRTVKLSAGETVLLTVTLKVTSSLSDAGSSERGVQGDAAVDTSP